MPHYNAYDSFKAKKSLDKKQKAKEKALSKKNDVEFVVKNAQDYGVVIEVRYNDAYVLYNEKIVVAKLRKDINLACNQVIFPGDKVVLDKVNNAYVIQNIVKRTSLLSRVKKDSTRLGDVGLSKNVAANIDLAVIDRYLMILQNSKIPAIICLNKCDLKTKEEERILDVYREIGIPVIETSAYQNIGIEELKSYLYHKQAIFVGNSGVGKSSLTNAIMEEESIKTSHVSDKSKRGRHTTTTSKYYVWEEDSSIIDTPGIRSLDVSTLSPMEIQDYFPELNNWKTKCKYRNCLHYKEPFDLCMVKQAVANGFINSNRYESYLRIMSDLLDEKEYEEILEELLPKNKSKKNELH